MAKMTGIDISYHQGDIDFSKVSKNVDFVILREGYRRVIDAKFLNYVDGFTSAGVPIHGVYHFIYGTTKEEVLAEAKSCLANVKKAKLPKTCRIWCDIEYDTIEKAKNLGIEYTPKMVNEYSIAFLEYIKSQGYPVGIYLNNDYYNNYYYKSTLDKYDLWLADYTGGPDHDCLYQQYSESGKINGIYGNVDLDYYYGPEVNIVNTAKAALDTIAVSSTGDTSSVVEKAISWMEALAKDNSHGYDQTYRWGERGDYDCSSAVITAWQTAGVPVKSGGATYTGNMYDVFIRNGFQDVTSSINLSNGFGLIRGDVLLNHVHHTAMYCGNGFEVEASINEYGGATGGSPGDQTGKEILIKNYRNYPWNVVLRYPSDSKTSSKEGNTNNLSSVGDSVLLKLGSTGEEVKSLQKKLAILGYKIKITGKFNAATERKIRHFQKKYGLEVDGIVGEKTLGKIDEIISLSSASDNTSSDKRKRLYSARVTADTLNVRTGPGVEYPKNSSCSQIFEGEYVDVYGVEYAASNGNPWLYVLIRNKYYGYVSGNYAVRV